MKQETMLWAWYLAGALAALTWKFLCYCRIGRKMGRRLVEIAEEWIFEHSPENAVSWIATILVVWAAGVLFIEDMAWVQQIPPHPAFAALFGYVMEYTAPNVCKWLLSKTPWASS